jgi:hypothetical protein
MSVLGYAIATSFFLVDYTSLPLTVGILTGMLGLPNSGMLHHWIGMAHAVGRTMGIVAVWYLFPHHRFTAVPVVIVPASLVSIPVVERRWRRIPSQPLAAMSECG